MYNVKDIKIIPYVRFQTPDGVLHDTMEKALAHRPPYCKPGRYAMWCHSEEKYSRTEEYGEAILLFISNDEAVSEFEMNCDFFEASSDGVSSPGWYAWDHSEKIWSCIPDYIGESLVRE